MKEKILLGFELGSGKEVYLSPAHLVITGMTGESGKTTTLEALLNRGQLTGLAFRTKRGELGFEQANRIRPYFSEEGLTQWRALEGLLSATLGEKVQREPGVRGAIIRLCSGTRTLEEVYRRNSLALAKAKGFQQDVHEKIRAYLDLVMPQLKETPLSDELLLERDRLNVMDLEGLSEEMQNLIIFASTEHIYHVEKNVVLVMPEAAKFIPQDRGSPCKVAIERFVREGRAVGNWLWIDSQDMRGVDKKYLRHCDNWILGRQRLMLEVESTLDAIPVPKNMKPKPEEIQQLELGHFIACLHNDVKRVYVMPSWLNEGQARNVALGNMKPPPKPPLVIVSVDKEARVNIQPLGKLIYDSVIETRFNQLAQKIEKLDTYFSNYVQAQFDEAGKVAFALAEANQKIEGLKQGLAMLDERVHSWEKLAQDPSRARAPINVELEQPATELTITRRQIKLSLSDNDIRARIASIMWEKASKPGRPKDWTLSQISQELTIRNWVHDQPEIQKALGDMIALGLVEPARVGMRTPFYSLVKEKVKMIEA